MSPLSLFLCVYAASLALLLSFSSAALADRQIVSFSTCPGNDIPSSSSVVWSSDDIIPGHSILEYSLCGPRSADLRYVTHARLRHYDGETVIVDRTFPICIGSDPKIRQACLDQLARSTSACLTGSLPSSLPVFVNSPDGTSRTEFLVLEGTDVMFTLCSSS